MIIAIGIKPKTGKDRVAKLFRNRFGFPIVHISSKLYQVCCSLYGISYEDFVKNPEETSCYSVFRKSPKMLLNEFTIKTVEITPNIFDYLAERLCAENVNRNIIISDVKRKSEVDIIRRYKSVLINVVRSKEDLPIADNMFNIKWDYVIDNTGTIEDLQVKVMELCNRMKQDGYF